MQQIFLHDVSADEDSLADLYEHDEAPPTDRTFEPGIAKRSSICFIQFGSNRRLFVFRTIFRISAETQVYWPKRNILPQVGVPLRCERTSGKTCEQRQVRWPQVIGNNDMVSAYLVCRDAVTNVHHFI